MDTNQSHELIIKLAKLLHKEKGSDIILNANANPALKIDGRVRYLRDIKLSAEEVEEVVLSLLNDKQYEEFQRNNELSFMLQYTGIANFRGSAYRQKSHAGVVLRIIPLEIPSFDDLYLPAYLKQVITQKRGMIIVSGPTGAGKSSTLASMIDYRNENFSDHIITIEDPIEFLHTNKKSVVMQREVGVDTASYSSALKNALRQAPDVVLVGEIRDLDVMMQAIHFSETGHLVLATLHATSTSNTLDRITNFFPKTERHLLMNSLANELKCIIGQRLMLSSTGKGRVPAFEIMTITPHIKQLIGDNRSSEVYEAMLRSTKSEGVFVFDDYIFDCYEEGLVTYDEAIKYVDSVNNFRIRLRSSSQRELPDELKGGGADSWSVEAPVYTPRDNRSYIKTR